jgi:hypothetical protein
MSVKRGQAQSERMLTRARETSVQFVKALLIACPISGVVLALAIVTGAPFPAVFAVVGAVFLLLALVITASLRPWLALCLFVLFSLGSGGGALDDWPSSELDHEERGIGGQAALCCLLSGLLLVGAASAEVALGS